MQKQSEPHHRRFAALLGLLLGLGAPLGWLAWRFFAANTSVLIPWIKLEFAESGAIYIYLAIGTVTVFTLFGYFLGRKNDDVTVESETVKDALNQMANTDALTNIHNARYLHSQLLIELESAKRHQVPVACLMIDIDDFKTINDTYGHPFGDMVLSNVAKILRESLRQIDIVGRLGGEEFLVIMPHTSKESAAPVAERIRLAVQGWSYPTTEKNVHVTVSLGLASFPAENISSKSALLKAADEALYEAKRTGKNRTVVSKNISEATSQCVVI